ncbi:hypothetical protein BN3660_03129 [Eubacteriaceae bacterium CHKCI004]|nr:hypothetical protein BN3660_03129 [Eubacteriaceae bacterium CHKCI004]
MRLKLWIKKHRKGCLYLLVFVVLTRILLALCYFSAWSGAGQWRVMCHMDLADNPDHVWSGNIYYYGIHAPEKIWVRTTLDEWTDDQYYESVNYGFWDDRCGEASNMSRIFLDVIAPSLPARGAYSFMAMGDRSKSGKIEIKWEENGEMKYAVVEWP